MWVFIPNGDRQGNEIGRFVGAIFFSFLLVSPLFGCVSPGFVETWSFLEDIAAGDGPSRLKEIRPDPSMCPVSYVVSGRKGAGDLYLPGAGAPSCGIVLVPGIVPDGKDDARIAAFARTLARMGFAVLIPEIAGFRDLVASPGQIREVADAFSFMAADGSLSPCGRAGIAALSYSVGLAVQAAIEPDIRDRVRFVLGIGGYHDLARTLVFLTTGLLPGGESGRLPVPDPYGRLVFACSSIPRLSTSQDRAILREMIRARLSDPAADISGLARGLGREGLSVYEFLENRDPERAFALYAGLPAEVRRVVDGLSLAGKDLSPLSARLILLHGKTDPVIPYPEGIALAEAIGREKAALFLFNSLLFHVELSPIRFLSPGFWLSDLPDFARLSRAARMLLNERR